MSISFQDLAHDCVSFNCISGLGAGQLCYVNANNTVKVCTDDSPIHGQAQSVRCDVANVAVHGFVTANYNGTEPTIGYCPLVAFNGITVKVSEGAKEYLVVNVDTVRKTVCFLL